MNRFSSTLDLLQPNAKWAKLPLFDRKAWKTVRFGDVVDNLNERCDPIEAGLDRFIGLEHLEPGSLHVRKWGNVADGVSFNRRCRPGHVLFGKRRAYQRKVAVAEFHAVVSGDIYVLAPKDSRLLPELLPFLCLSERFFQHAVGTSAGSLSPRTNWSSLASFEFDLPPLDQQQRLAQLLIAANDTTTAWKATADQHSRALFNFASRATLRGLRDEATKHTQVGEIPVSWRCVRIEELTEHCAYGPRFPSSCYNANGNAYQIRTTDFDRNGGVNYREVPAATLDERTVLAHRLRTGDFLLSRSGEYAGLTAVFTDPNDGRAYVAGAFLIYYRLAREFDSAYLLALCNSAFGDCWVKALATGSAQPNIAGSAFSGLYVPVPPINEQRDIIEVIAECRRTGDTLARHVMRSQITCAALLNAAL